MTATPTALSCPQCGRSHPSGTENCDCGYYLAVLEDMRVEGAMFFPVATHKFIVLCLCTLGGYQLYWFYQNWKRIRDREQETLSPFWRTVFMVPWTIPLLRRIHQRAEDLGVAVSWNPVLLGALFMCATVMWKAPGLWGDMTLVSFALLIPAVRTCRKVNAICGNVEGLNNKYTIANVVTIVLGGLLFALAVAGMFLPEYPEYPEYEDYGYDS